MWARVSRFQGPADRIEEDIVDSREAAETIKKIPGSRGIYYLVDRDSGRAMAVTLWEDEQSLRASEEAANRVREDSARKVGQDIISVEHYEVALQPE